MTPITADDARSAPGSTRYDDIDVLLVCTPGGHLLQLAALREAWRGYTTAWVTGDTSVTRSLLAGERVFHAHEPAARSVVNLVRNVRLAWHLVRRLRPSVVVSTGAALAVPFIWVARIYGIKVFYVETVTRIDSPSLSCRLARPAAHRVYVQWPELVSRVRGSVYVGSVFTTR